jgi:RimJ/RimL family protein N-acetyltransferase
MISRDLILETDRFLLRRLTKADEPALIRYAETEPGLWTYSLAAINSREDMIRYVDEALAAHEKGSAYPLVVIEKATGQVVGSTRYYDFQPQYATTQLGYTWYSQRLQGNGINAHCKFLLLRYAFEELGLERVEFRADTRNLRSLAAMRKIGCVEEGVLRNHLPTADGSRRDSIVLSILRNEWNASVKERLASRL